MPSGHGRDRLAARYNLSNDPRLVLVAPRSPTTRTGEHLEPMNRLSDSIIHCVHSKPNGYQNHQTRRSGHHQEGDLGTPLTVSRNSEALDRRWPERGSRSAEYDYRRPSLWPCESAAAGRWSARARPPDGMSVRRREMVKIRAFGTGSTRP